MQSILAYRRFGRLVQEQYEKNRHRAEAMERGNALNTEANANEVGTSVHRASSIDSTSSTNVPSPASFDSRDLEKGEQPDTHFPPPSPLGDNVDIPAERTVTAHTNHSFGTRLGHALTGIEVRELSAQLTRTLTKRGKILPPRTMEKPGEREKEIVFVVGYESESDQMNPHNWSITKRIVCTFMIAGISFIVGFASSIDSAALTQASEEFGVSEVAESLATGLFLVGFGFGGLLSGPISETIGRNPVYIVTLIIYMIWIMASALAPNLGAQLVFRFLAGFFGATPLTCAGGSISDLWDPIERVFAFPIFANAAFMGPIFGPVVGGFVGQSSLVSWRWCEWITLIISGAILILIFLFMPETFTPILLKWKASHLRRITQDERYVAEVEIRADSFGKRLIRALYRPFILTVREPIVMLFALYLTVVYIILFTFLDGYAYVFGETYGFSEGLVGLSFAGIGVGLCFASLLVPLIYYWARRDLAKLRAEKGPNARLAPEQRLWFAMFGAPAVPISLFWMGWTNYSSISPWSGLAASLLFGYGILCIFISSYQYILDAYETYAASALAGFTLIRYVASGGMVEVGIPFYENLGVHWTLTILGIISAVMVPVPYLFYIYGPTIRGWSKYAVIA